MSPFSFQCISSLSPFVSFYSHLCEVIGKKFRCAKFFGGDDGIRTHDPLLAGQVLSQLSYTPLGVCECPLESLKIEQQQTRTRSKSLFLAASKSYLFRFRLSTYDTASCVFRSMPLSP